MDFAQSGVVLFTAEAETHAKLLRKPLLGNAVAVEFMIPEEVKSAVFTFDHLKDLVLKSI